MISQTTLPYNTRIVLGLIIPLGVSVLVVAVFILLLGLLWLVAFCITTILAYTSSVNLLIMIVVGYEVVKVGIRTARKRGVL